MGGRDPEPARLLQGAVGTPPVLVRAGRLLLHGGPVAVRSVGLSSYGARQKGGAEAWGSLGCHPRGSEAEVHSLPVRVACYYGNSPITRGCSALANWVFILHPIFTIRFCRMRLPLK